MQKGWYFGQPSECETRDESFKLVGNNKLETKLDTIDKVAQEKFRLESIGKSRIENRKLLNTSERSIKLGFVCLFLRYFNLVDVVRREKSRWSQEGRITSEQKKKEIEVLTNERIKMIQEEHNLKHHQALIQHFYKKAKYGAEQAIQRKNVEVTERVSFFYSRLLYSIQGRTISQLRKIHTSLNCINFKATSSTCYTHEKIDRGIFCYSYPASL